MKNHSPACASHCSMDNASFGSSVAFRSQVADMDLQCLEGCVHVTHSAVARRVMYTVDRAIDPSVSVQWSVMSESGFLLHVRVFQDFLALQDYWDFKVKKCGSSHPRYQGNKYLTIYAVHPSTLLDA